MAQVDDLLIKIDATTESLRRELKRADTAITSSVGRWDKSLQRADKAFASLTTAATRLMGGLVAFAGVRAFSSALSDMVRETDLAARNLVRTEALLKATGNTVGTTAQALREEARSVAAATLQSTESVQAAQQVLLTFRSVTGDTFNRTIELATDMATVFGTSLNSSITQLGKALEDPITGLTALRRVGVSFTEDQKALIKSLVETNRLAEAQAVILDTLAQQFGGVAKAEANSLAGSLDTLSQKWQEFSIGVGEATGVVEFFREGIGKVAADLEALTNAMDGLGFQRFADEQSKFNYIIGERIRLQEEMAAKLAEIEKKWYLTDRQKEIASQRVRDSIGEEIKALDERARAMQNERKARSVARKAAQDQAAAERAAADERRRAAANAALWLSIFEDETKARTESITGIVDQARELEALAGKYDDVYAAIDAYNDVQQDMQRLHAANMVTQDGWTDALNDALNAAEGFGEAMEGVGVKTKAAGEELDVIADQTLRRLEDAFVDTWRSMLAGAENAFSSLKRMLVDTLAEMAHAAVTRPIMLSVGGSLGLSGTAAGSNLLGTAGSALSGAGSLGMLPGLATAGIPAISGLAAGFQGASMAIGAGGYFASAGSIMSGAGAALSTGNIATAIGMAAPYLLPLAALAVPVISKLFADKTDPRLGFGDRSFTGDGAFEDGVFYAGPFSRVGYRGASHGMDAGSEAYRGILQAVVTMDELVAGLMSAEEIARAADYLQNAPGRGDEKYGHGFDTSLVDLSGMSETKLAALMTERLREITQFAGSAAGRLLARYVEGFSGTTEELADGLSTLAGGLTALQQQLDADIVAQYAHDVEQANRSLVDVYVDQWNAVNDLAASYDGSVQATLDLANANAALQGAMYQMLAVIDAASASVSAAFGGLRQTIELDLLDAQGKYDYFTTAAEDLAVAMSGMKDPKEIADAVAEINSLASSAWSGLTPEQKAAMGEGFLGVLDDVEGLALENLGNLRDAVEADALNIKDVIGGAVENAAVQISNAAIDINSAASTMQTAADRLAAATGRPVQVTVNYPDFTPAEVNA